MFAFTIDPCVASYLSGSVTAGCLTSSASAGEAAANVVKPKAPNNPNFPALDNLDINIEEVKRLWLHQANLSMNQLIAKKLLGRDPDEQEMPIILNDYANTSSAGSIIAFHQTKDDFVSNEIGVISSFGAGYSVGSVVLQKV